MIDVPDGQRVTIRLHQQKVEQVAIGDTVRFTKPWRKHKRVKDIEIIEKAHV
jgi:ASC-1-like (ASCH) protein